MKIIRVENCRGCETHFNHLSDECAHPDPAASERPIPDPDTIPDWCPLEDAEPSAKEILDRLGIDNGGEHEPWI